ncbi:uncharacterized protein LOC130758716 [Actinidia eriantha]|uniref:uncharacterized protein LOC130758716 n=1 Tax=Actinidia eriantha TaxID=165200 RepID=UPI002584416D|nr:uncharacterized protein LOC130758716 [Actinidia eriantha]
MTAEIVGSCNGLVCLTDRLVFHFARRAYRVRLKPLRSSVQNPPSLVFLPNFFGKVKSEFEVYSLKVGSWRKVGAVVPRTAHSDSAFDLEEEVFREMKLHPKLLNRFGESMDSDSLELRNFKNRFVYRLRGDECCYVWWMREYGEAKSWTKQFTIVPRGSWSDR